MEAVFQLLAANPYILLFLAIGMGRVTIKGYGLGMVASASSVPWIGFPVGYAVSGVLLTVFGYVAMALS